MAQPEFIRDQLSGSSTFTSSVTFFQYAVSAVFQAAASSIEAFGTALIICRLNAVWTGSELRACTVALWMICEHVARRCARGVKRGPQALAVGIAELDRGRDIVFGHALVGHHGERTKLAGPDHASGARGVDERHLSITGHQIVGDRGAAALVRDV